MRDGMYSQYIYCSYDVIVFICDIKPENLMITPAEKCHQLKRPHAARESSFAHAWISTPGPAQPSLTSMSWADHVRPHISFVVCGPTPCPGVRATVSDRSCSTCQLIIPVRLLLTDNLNYQ
jgi:hypothetical protein